MTRKRDIARPFPPEYVSAETAAYLLDLSRSTFDDYVRRHLLPQSVTVGAMPRWRWRDLDSHILAINGLAPDGKSAPPSEPDRFDQGAKRAAAHA